MVFWTLILIGILCAAGAGTDKDRATALLRNKSIYKVRKWMLKK